MARQNFAEVWSESGTNVDPGTVKNDLGWIAEKPPFQYFNWILNRADQMLQHIEQNGMPVWDALTTYPDGGWCIESGVFYKSLQAANTNNLVSDTDFWSPLPTVLNVGHAARTVVDTDSAALAQGVVYRAQTDGYAVVNSGDAIGTLICLLDTVNPPVFEMQQDEANAKKGHMTIPVNRDDYIKFTAPAALHKFVWVAKGVGGLVDQTP